MCLRELRLDVFGDRLGLSFFVTAMWPEREAITFETRNEVHMRVMYGLAGMFTVVHHDVHAVGAQCGVERDCE